ncbi:hypothetical protein QQ045_021988 [Rhodiola kirilowii]
MEGLIPYLLHASMPSRKTSRSKAEGTTPSQKARRGATTCLWIMLHESRLLDHPIDGQGLSLLSHHQLALIFQHLNHVSASKDQSA